MRGKRPSLWVMATILGILFAAAWMTACDSDSSSVFGGEQSIVTVMGASE